MNQVGMIFAGAAVIGIGWAVIGYNRLVRLRQAVRGAWAQIDVQLTRRHDLIPNLVEVVRGYLAHERQTLENVATARARAVQAQGMAGRQEAENVLTQTLRSLFVVVERYPVLQASQNMLSLQEELTSTENRIAFARQFYNDEVVRLNTLIQSVPLKYLAAIAGLQPAEFFQIDDPAHRAVPSVRL